MTFWTLRVVWPVEDDGTLPAEAIAAAWFELPKFAEEQQANLAGQPRFRVVDCSELQRVQLRAARAVVCEVPVIRRTTPIERKAAA